MYKITCKAKGGADYLIVLKATLAPDTIFLTEVEADWSPIGSSSLSQELEKCLQENKVPVIQNYGHEVLAAFTAKQVHTAWIKAKSITLTKSGPQLYIKEMVLWKRDDAGEWIAVDPPT